EQAQLAVQIAPPETRAAALMVLGMVERLLGEDLAAERDLHAALALNLERLPVSMLQEIASFFRRRNALGQALSVARQALIRAQRDVDDSPESPQALENPLACLLDLGDI